MFRKVISTVSSVFSKDEIIPTSTQINDVDQPIALFKANYKQTPYLLLRGSQIDIEEATKYLKSQIMAPHGLQYCDSGKDSTGTWILAEQSTPIKLNSNSILTQLSQTICSGAIATGMLWEYLSFLHTNCQTHHGSIGFDIVFVTTGQELRFAKIGSIIRHDDELSSLLRGYNQQINTYELKNQDILRAIALSIAFYTAERAEKEPNISILSLDYVSHNLRCVFERALNTGVIPSAESIKRNIDLYQNPSIALLRNLRSFAAMDISVRERFLGNLCCTTEALPTKFQQIYLPKYLISTLSVGANPVTILKCLAPVLKVSTEAQFQRTLMSPIMELYLLPKRSVRLQLLKLTPLTFRFVKDPICQEKITNEISSGLLDSTEEIRIATATALAIMCDYISEKLHNKIISSIHGLVTSHSELLTKEIIFLIGFCGMGGNASRAFKLITKILQSSNTTIMHTHILTALSKFIDRVNPVDLTSLLVYIPKLLENKSSNRLISLSLLSYISNKLCTSVETQDFSNIWESEGYKFPYEENIIINTPSNETSRNSTILTKSNDISFHSVGLNTQAIDEKNKIQNKNIETPRLEPASLFYQPKKSDDVSVFTVKSNSIDGGTRRISLNNDNQSEWGLGLWDEVHREDVKDQYHHTVNTSFKPLNISTKLSSHISKNSENSDNWITSFDNITWDDKDFNIKIRKNELSPKILNETEPVKDSILDKVSYTSYEINKSVISENLNFKLDSNISKSENNSPLTNLQAFSGVTNGAAKSAADNMYAINKSLLARRCSVPESDESFWDNQ